MNNHGGCICSFLPIPIANHGNDVNFEEFFGTPTHSFLFEKGAEAFGRPFDSVTELQGKVQRVSPLRRIIHFRSKGGEKKQKC